MILRKLSLLVALALPAVAAHAQLGLYGTISAERVTNISYTNGNNSSNNAEIDPIGATFGAYYDFKNLGPVRLGADARGIVTRASKGAFTDSNGFGSHLYSVLGGVRLSFRTPLPILRPYVEGAAGLGRTNYGTQYTLSNNVEYHGYAGLDLHITPIFELRVLELGYGGLSGSTPTSRQYPMESVSTGLVVRLPF